MRLAKKKGVMYKITRVYQDGTTVIRYAQAINSPIDLEYEEVPYEEYEAWKQETDPTITEE